MLVSSCAVVAAGAQELYVYTEPASNMSKGSIGVRLTNKFMKMKSSDQWRYRAETELMLGVSRKLMLHFNTYSGNVYRNKFIFEGASLYGKYRFLSNDDVHRHFRMAAFLKLSASTNRSQYLTPHGHYELSADIDLDGNNSGLATGVIATKLEKRLALSSSVSYVRAVKNINSNKSIIQYPRQGVNYTASIGYLLLPKEYVSYRQTNMNLYLEYTGQTASNYNSYGELNPAVQFIFNSIARLDVGTSFVLYSSSDRMTNGGVLLRFEYNFLNVLKAKNK